MRVLHIIASVDPRSGGPAEALRTSLAEFRHLGHQTEVVTLDGPGEGSSFPAPVHALGPGLGRFRYAPRFARWIEANARRFDVAVIHGLWNYAAIGGYGALRRSNLPYVVVAHGMMARWFREQHPLKHLAKQAFWSLRQGRVIADACRVLFACEEEARSAQGVFSGPPFEPAIVTLGVPDVPAASAGDPRPSVTPQRPYILFLGRLHPIKGCDILLEAFAPVAGDVPFDLVLAGPDQTGQQRSLEALAHTLGIANRIHWPGMISGQDKADMLRGADALVLPSHHESFGMVVAEALACARPVLISDKVNIWREVHRAHAGLVAEDTPAGIESLLRAFAAMPMEERAAMGRAARDLYETQFGAHNAAQALAAVLTNCVQFRVDTRSISRF